MNPKGTVGRTGMTTMGWLKSDSAHTVKVIDTEWNQQRVIFQSVSPLQWIGSYGRSKNTDSTQTMEFKWLVVFLVAARGKPGGKTLWP